MAVAGAALYGSALYIVAVGAGRGGPSVISGASEAQLFRGASRWSALTLVLVLVFVLAVLGLVQVLPVLVGLLASLLVLLVLSAHC